MRWVLSTPGCSPAVAGGAQQEESSADRLCGKTVPWVKNSALLSAGFLAMGTIDTVSPHQHTYVHTKLICTHNLETYAHHLNTYPSYKLKANAELNSDSAEHS